MSFWDTKSRPGSDDAGLQEGAGSGHSKLFLTDDRSDDPFLHERQVHADNRLEHQRKDEQWLGDFDATGKDTQNSLKQHMCVASREWKI